MADSVARFQPRDPAYADRVATAFEKESAARWGGGLTSVEPGSIGISLPCGEELSAAPGVMSRGVVAALLDDACLLAALSLSPAGDMVATAEYKLNFLSPAVGTEVVASAQVVRPGRSITVCRGNAFVGDRLVASMLATLTVSRPAS